MIQYSFWPGRVVLKLECTKQSPGRLVATQVAGPIPEFPASLQMILMLLVWKSSFENFTPRDRFQFWLHIRIS